MAEFAHPADLSGGVAHNEGVVGDFFGDDGTGTDKGKTSDGVATDDGGVGSDGGAFFLPEFGRIRSCG